MQVISQRMQTYEQCSQPKTDVQEYIKGGAKGASVLSSRRQLLQNCGSEYRRRGHYTLLSQTVYTLFCGRDKLFRETASRAGEV